MSGEASCTQRSLLTLALILLTILVACIAVLTAIAFDQQYSDSQVYTYEGGDWPEPSYWDEETELSGTSWVLTSMPTLGATLEFSVRGHYASGWSVDATPSVGITSSVTAL